MKFGIIFHLFASLLFFLNSCNTDSVFLEPNKIIISPVNANKIKASDLLIFKGFTMLEHAGGQPLRSISKVLFADNTIIVLDAETDFEDIYRYEANTGKFINKIGFQSKLPGGYDELYDIDLNTEKNQVVGFSTGNTSFMIYDFQGNLIRKLPNGSLGEHFVTLPDGGYVIYNEYTSTEISGFNFLVFYDNQGNVLKQAMPYPDSLDEYGYGVSGFIGKNGKDVVFSPPFNDTVFVIRNMRVMPLHVFDFQERAIAKSKKYKKMGSEDISGKVSFLHQGMVKSKNLTLFHYRDDFGPTLGIYNEKDNKFWEAIGFQKKDPMYKLIQFGSIFPKENEQFALVLEPKMLKNMLKNGTLDLVALAMAYPELSKAIEANVGLGKYILLYFEAK